jgi:hypothetical protein
MKILIVLALFTVCIPVFAQEQHLVYDTVVPTTELERLQEQTGAVIIKSFSAIGVARGTSGALRVEAVDLLDALNQRHRYGLILQITQFGKDHHEASAFVDYGEIDPLLKAGEDISKVTEAVTKLQNFEARYATNGGVSLVVFNSPAGEINAAVEIEHNGAERALFTLNDFAKLRQIIANAKLKLDGIRQ